MHNYGQINAALKKIRQKLINGNFKVLGKSSNRVFGAIFDSSLTYEENFMKISEHSIGRYKNFDIKTRSKANFLFKDLRRGSDNYYSIEQQIWKSNSQAGKNISGQVFQRQIAFFLKKVGLKVKVNENCNDIVITFRKKKFPIAVKISVRDRSNDNDSMIKIIQGNTNNNCGGFTREGFTHWIEGHESKILIIINPEARKQTVEYAQRVHNFTPKVYGLDEGIKKIKEAVKDGSFAGIGLKSYLPDSKSEK
jgi:hypothetical protein